MVKRSELSKEQVDDILAKAEMSGHNPVLKKQNVITTGAFPSIIKSAASFYLDRTGDIATVNPLVPYIEGQKDCQDVLYLHHFKSLPYPVDQTQVTHMIHIQGSSKTGSLYAMMEYYSIYVYIVVIDRNYGGEVINMTYTNDVVAGQEVDRQFDLPLTMKVLEDFRNQPHEQYLTYLPFIQKRADAVMAIWEKDNEEQNLHDVVEKAFGRFPEGCVLEPYMVDQIQQDIMDYFEKRIVRSFRLKGE